MRKIYFSPGEVIEFRQINDPDAPRTEREWIHQYCYRSVMVKMVNVGFFKTSDRIEIQQLNVTDLSK